MVAVGYAIRIQLEMYRKIPVCVASDSELIVFTTSRLLQCLQDSSDVSTTANLQGLYQQPVGAIAAHKH